MKLKENLFELNVLNEIKCYILITLMYMPNTCRLVWNKNYMISEISVKVFRSGRKLVGPAETENSDITNKMKKKKTHCQNSFKIQ